MAALPALVLLTAAAGLGLIMGWRYLRGLRNAPVMIGSHLLLGAGGLEVLAMLLRGAPDGSAWHGGSLRVGGTALLAAALFTGLTVPLIARQAPRGASYVLAAHAAIAAAGFACVAIAVLLLR
jgi:hypothetical protein